MQKTTQDRKRKMNAKEKQRLLVVAGIIVFSILIVFGILYFVFRSRVMSTADNEIYNNVYVETVDVSGMKKGSRSKDQKISRTEYFASYRRRECTSDTRRDWFCDKRCGWTCRKGT